MKGAQKPTSEVFPTSDWFFSNFQPSWTKLCVPFLGLWRPFTSRFHPNGELSGWDHLQTNTSNNSDEFVFLRSFRTEKLDHQIIFSRQNGSIELLAFTGIISSSSKGVDWHFLRYFTDFFGLFSIFWGQFQKNHQIWKFCSCQSLHSHPNSRGNHFLARQTASPDHHIQLSHASQIGGFWLSPTVC